MDPYTVQIFNSTPLTFIEAPADAHETIDLIQTFAMIGAWVGITLVDVGHAVFA